MREDPIEIDGVVVAQPTVEAPFTGLRCVLYRVELTVVQRLLDGWSDGDSEETAGTRFWVECRLGMVLLDPAEAVLSLSPVTRGTMRLGLDPAADARIAALYARLSRRPRRAHVTCRERRLHVGQRVWARGTLAHMPDPGGIPEGYREPPRVPMLAADEVRAVV